MPKAPKIKARIKLQGKVRAAINKAANWSFESFIIK
jgi:hypothetical protein